MDVPTNLNAPINTYVRAGCTSIPNISSSINCLQEYEEEHSKLLAVVSTMEENIKALLKDFDAKKKVYNPMQTSGDPLPIVLVQILQANPLMETERKLFVFFFTNPGKLRQAVSELAQRIDALATATSVNTST